MTGGRTPPRSRLCSRSPNSTATSCRAPSRTRQGAWRSSRRIGGLCCCSPTCSCSPAERPTLDRKSTRLKLQSLPTISYAVFCLKKKNQNVKRHTLPDNYCDDKLPNHHQHI